MEKHDELNGKERLILAIITSKKRSMSAKQVAEELKNNYGFRMSRPTITKYLKNLKKRFYLIEVKPRVKV